MNNKITNLKIITIKTCNWNDSYWKSFTQNYNNIFDKNFTIDFFKNKYKSSSMGFSFHSLLINDLNEVVGACTVMPYLYSRNSETLNLGQAVDVFIVEKYRSNPMMLRDMYLELKEQLLLNEIICVLAVPNKNVFKYWTNVVKWKHIGNLNYWVHPIKIGSALNTSKFLDKLSLLFSAFLGFLNCIFCKILYDNKNHNTYKIIQNDVFVPSAQHLIVHNILNHEINDEGYRYQRINFRSVYDTLILCKSIYIVKPTRNIIKELCKNKYVRNHFNKTNVFFNDLKNEYSKQDKFFTFWLTNPKLSYWKDISIKRIVIIKILANRLIKSLSNTDYRHDLWNDRKRVIENFKAKF